MTVRVLVVDDSPFFRRQLCSSLAQNPGIEVVGTAEDGRQAVEKTLALRPDLITMDYAMPVMDGIHAVRKIMGLRPTPILMFSALTFEGAQATLDSLEAGALDFLPKNKDALRGAPGQRNPLHERVLALGRALPQANHRLRKVVPSTRSDAQTTRSQPPQLIAIGASTGGPVAVQTLLRALPARFPVPIAVAVHMPHAFTGTYAQRLDRDCALQVKEAQDGDRLEPGSVLIAPGAHQMRIERGRVRISADKAAQLYAPSVDELFTTAAAAYSSRVLGIVLTGMGQDGARGAATLRSAHARVWAQDEASSVIFGMPAAVARAGLADAVLGLGELGPSLIEVSR
ncbi:MAG: chemotaxis response regulator protein-glutamate methylesterase [Pseudomonadota bacterium]|nr:chemotaxis response regulator protein-glutamate methylesterase [Pseudomonadota bacterium]